MRRRDFCATMAGAAVASFAQTALAANEKPSVQAGEIGFPPMHSGRLPEVGMLLYPGMTLMDLLGPQTVLATSCHVHLLWKNTDLIETDTGVLLKPRKTLAECPKDLDVLFVGGGPGQIGVMQDDEVLAFVADRGTRAKYVTSVCTGSLILGAAGLLKGYRATSHWGAHGVLSLFGATPVAERVVIDRNRMTGGGVTAGIDFGLVLLATLLGEDVAKMTQLSLEYDPAPPFSAGSPQGAGPEITSRVEKWLGPIVPKLTAVCAEAATKMDRYGSGR